jgi:LPS-assembly lipoprotein
MNPSRPARPIITAGLVLAAAALSAGLGGCIGFTPLYAAEGVVPKLSAIEVAQPDGRLGFLMRQSLTDALARDGATPAIYRLAYTNRELRVPRGITVSNVASRYEVDLDTTYTLTEIATKKVITNGKVSVSVTYDVQDQPYASLSAQQDGERRAAEQAADRVRLELATFFASPRPTPKAGFLEPTSQASYSERLSGSVVQTPREQASGDLQINTGQDDPTGQVRSLTVRPDTVQPFSPPQDPNNAPAANTVLPTPADPTAIKTLPDPNAAGQ